jgi:hypothetical protein
MSFQTMADLSQDENFRERVTACATQQALIFKDDGRADIAALADAIVISSVNATGLIPLVAVAPNFVDVTDQLTIPDEDILAAVQAQWPVYAAVAYPPPEAPPAVE